MNLDLFGVGIKSRSEIMTAQRRVNVFYEEIKDDDRGSRIAVIGTPGREAFVNFAAAPARLLYEKDDYLYVVHGTTFYEIDNVGTATARGALLTGEGRCYADDNGSQIMVTDSGNYGYIYTIATNDFAQITDPNFPGALNVTWQDGFFIVPKPNSGRWHISASYDGTAWTASDFKNAESQPDNNVLAYSYNGTLMMFGSLTTEFYSNVGAQGVPFTRIQGATLQWGLAAKDSLCPFQDSVVGLLRNELGQMQIARISGYKAQRISTSDLESIIRGYDAFQDATGLSYMIDGHPFYQINFPTGNASWLYDGLTGVWSELQSSGGRDRAEMHCVFLNQNIVADFENGLLYRIDPDVYTDNGNLIRRLLVSKHITNGGNPLTIDELRLFFETGNGLATGQGSDPTVMLRVSKDGGRTYGPERTKSLGILGDYRARVAFQRFGQAEDFVFEISMSDPVKFMLVGEAVEAEAHTWA